jgi:hypothetical protein
VEVEDLLHGVHVLPLELAAEMQGGMMFLAFMELQLPSATFWKTAMSCGCQQCP